MSEVEDMIAEGGRPEDEVVEVEELVAQPERPAKKVVTPAAELVEDEVVDSPEEDRMGVRIELSRLVFRSPMKNSQSVRYLQDLLVEAGCPIGSDQRGWLCEGTRDALKAFQGRAHLPTTGQADEATVDALFARSREYVREL
jgi:hypothetical protein